MLGLHAYHCSKRIGLSANEPFYAIIAAAMRLADTDNLEKLKRAFPETWRELQARYHAPLGVIPEDGDVNMETLAKSLREFERQRR
jgi:hypothetical protein